MRNPGIPALVILCLAATLTAQTPTGDQLPDTQPLTIVEPLHVVMVRGISGHAELELENSRETRKDKWNWDYSNPKAYDASITPHRERLREIIGAVDKLVDRPRFTIVEEYARPQVSNGLVPNSDVRWEVIDGVHGEGIQLNPLVTEEDFSVDAILEVRTANVIVLGDPAHTPEDLCGFTKRLKPAQQIARRFAENNCDVLVPSLINYETTHSVLPGIRKTNLPHREFIYRLGHELGRGVIGYEVQKVLAAVEAIKQGLSGWDAETPIVVVGIGGGAPIAMYAAALDTRIDGVVVSGYFGPREKIWQEPIDRNLFGLLTEFGDAEIASLIAPRLLVVDVAKLEEITGPPEPKPGESRVAAPGTTKNRAFVDVMPETTRVINHYSGLKMGRNFQIHEPTGADSADSFLKSVLRHFNVKNVKPPLELDIFQPGEEEYPQLADLPRYEDVRQQRQVEELVRHTQMLLHRSDKVRDRLWQKADRSSVEAWEKSAQEYRDIVHDTFIGRLPNPTTPASPRSRKVIDTDTHVGYEVTLDVFLEKREPKDTDAFDANVIAGGILLLPKDLQPGERRPVVVCQHGLEGTPMDTITTDQSVRAWGAYKGYATQLVERGFVVYAPQNPYKGFDDFRVIQRKANPLGRSLFSYIIEQHRQTLRWLATLPYVDRDRIGFYGLSYGGKTAMRVPEVLLPTEDEPGYCLSICSADFNEWIRKNASAEDRYSYIFTPEYEIWEWNMGHIAGYAELASLMAPRPFMVERGHDDGVAPDEWVGWEFAKVRRHYDKLGIGERAEIEWFNGPHTINGVGTFAFLHRHLRWPERE